MRHRIEPLGDRARELGLPAGQQLAHRVHAARGVGLDARDLGHALFQFADLQSCRAASSTRAREARASMTAIAPSSARATQAKAVTATPTVTA